MKILILGLGIHGGGFTSAKYFLNRGHDVRICDNQKSSDLGERLDYLMKKGATFVGTGDKTDFEWADYVIKNPLISPENDLLKYSKNITDEFSWLFSSPWTHNVKLIAITGAKGKTTTAYAVYHILQKCGYDAQICGNMGISCFTIMHNWENRSRQGERLPNYLICEMSKWQIRDTWKAMNNQFPKLEICILSNKDKIAKNSFLGNSFSIFLPETRVNLAFSKNRKILAENTRCSLTQIKSIDAYSQRLTTGLPDMEAAFATCRALGLRSKQINDALKSYHGIPNRTEMTGTAGNTLFINDSSTALPEAVSFTLEKFENLQVHLICGGSGNHLDATKMISTLKTVASLHLLPGSFTDEKLIPCLTKTGQKYFGPFKNMEEAVQSAWNSCDKACSIMQVVILCPGAQAFEYYSNQFNRGQEFTEAVQEILNQHSH